jgi:hypothetical protein
MARLDNPKRKALSQADFDQYPVWVWSDDNEHHQPISETEPSPEDYGTLFIKARLDAEDHSFDGYLIGGSTFYAFGMFVEGHEFVMNLNLPDMMDKNLADIAALLKCRPFKLFPIRFTSPVRLKGGQKIGGTINP